MYKGIFEKLNNKIDNKPVEMNLKNYRYLSIDNIV